VLINVVLYSAALILGYYYVADLINQFIPSWLHWLKLAVMALVFHQLFYSRIFTFTVLANPAGRAFLRQISAKTAAIINGQTRRSRRTTG